MDVAGTSDEVTEAALVAALTELEVEYTVAGARNYLVDLPGERKLKTTCMLTPERNGVMIEAFVCRHPDENEPKVHEFLLHRNRRIYGVSYTIDKNRDIYLVGRLVPEAVTAAGIDRILGQVLEAADRDFNILIELGFAESIRREWKWRVSRGESLKNLEAFRHLVPSDDDLYKPEGDVEG